MQKNKAMQKKLILFNSAKRLFKNNRKMIFAFIGKLALRFFDIIIKKLVDRLF